MALKVRLRAVILFSGIVLFGLAAAGRAETPGKQPVRITGIEWQEKADSFLVTIRSEVPPTYTMYELFNPSRIVLDIADATLAESAGLPKEINKGPVTAITGRLLDDQEPLITRIEIVLTKDSAFTVDRDENNILVKFASSPARKTDVHPPVAASLPSTGPAGPPTGFLLLEDVVVTAEPTETRVLLQAGAPITEYRKVRLPRGEGLPDRLYLDIPHTRMAENAKHITIGKALARVRMAHRGTGVRVVFDSGLDGPFNYDVETVPLGLMVTIPEPGTLATAAELIESKQPVMHGKAPGDKDVLSAELGPVIDAAARPHQSQGQKPEMPGPPFPAENDNAVPPTPDELAMAGYVAQKISVDFYKIDLHNVFRLIGEISGRNIVVDEAVNGTLTLALNEVPWDFVLDVVINLKDLHKEERFNTIVISPKAKEYSWPKRPIESLAIAADGAIRQEAISIKKKLETPKEILDAKKLILQGNEHYRAGKFDAALPFYEDAFSKWPANQQLGERIAAMALVQLGMNAKAVHYAKAVLELAPGNQEAALNAAIAMANMKKTAEAKEYFDLAIASNRPSAEALLSYAAFCEDNESLEASLVLLAKHETIHGDTLESMIAKARVRDKLGRSEEANEEYRAILSSGFEIPVDLKRYIDGRIAVAK